MNNKILHKAETYRKTHRKKQWLYGGLSVLAAGAVFCTTYALILPAITMEKEPTCGFTEHEHSAACFSENQVIGTYSCLSDLHVHEDDCFDSDGNIICGYADFVVHSHGEFCFDENGDLICELPEILVHTHNEDCFAVPEEAEAHEHREDCFILQKGELLCDTEEYAGHTHKDICVGINSKTLICTVEESEGHVHTEACEGIVSEMLSCGLEESEGHSHSGECYQTVQTENLICGSEETDGHVHDETCVDENGELICDNEETEGHFHSSKCYELTQELVCGLEESEGHAHSDDCYTIETGYICGLEESEGHIHKDDCYEIQNGYICGLEESEGHIHNDECYEWKKELVCDIESNEEPTEEDTELEAVCGCDEIILHEHDEIECFDEDGNLICGRMQVLEHIHTEECLVVEEQELICGLEEHIHDELLCYIDEEADIETEEDWEATLPEELSGNWAEDLIAVAESQLGYTESETNVLVGANGEISHYSRYGAWYGRPYAEWNAMFAAFCLNYAGIPEEVMPVSTNYEEWMEELREYDLLDEEEFAYKAGDILFYSQESDYRCLLITQLAEDSEVFYGIEGDLDGEVVLREMTPYDVEIVAVGKLPEQFGESDTGLVEDEDNSEAIRRLVESGWFEYWSQEENQFMYTIHDMSAYSLMNNSDDSVLLGVSELGAQSEESAVQIVNKGGTKEDDHVTVSKTIADTEFENIFDITLTVQTDSVLEEIYKEPDMAVVLVMDISHTMMSKIETNSDISKYEVAVDSAEQFVDKFAAATDGISKIGYVVFNTSAYDVCPMQSVSNTSQATVFKDSMRKGMQPILEEYAKTTNSDGDCSSNERYTNIEAGLKIAEDMLENTNNRHKFVIFLSDGLPTTYVESGYTGYYPISSSGTIGQDGVFYDRVSGKYCLYGASYSDKGAIRAVEAAESLKQRGISIYSIGVKLQSFRGTYDTSGTLDGIGLIRDQLERAENSDFSVIDNNCTGTSGDDGTGWTQFEVAKSGTFEEWLKNDIGSGVYYDCDKTEELHNAYDEIFALLSKATQESMASVWTVVDPIPYAAGETSYVEFIKFRNEDTDIISYDSETCTINWDLKTSPFTTTTEGNRTMYTYETKYRVRLANELKGFVENHIYDTNSTTTLQYQYKQTIDGVDSFSEIKSIDFPIPSVKGYLGELSFAKVNSLNLEVPVVGAEFTLAHDKSCTLCPHLAENDDLVFTAISDEDGRVSFSGIPSGHTYTLTETVVPDGYTANGNTYQVEVAYDEVTVTVTDRNGETVEWDETIINNTSYVLPSTGGIGTFPYTLGGLMIVGASGILFMYKTRRRLKE